jgi:hypothetical protein
MDAELEIAEHVRSAGDAEGAVLLDLRSGKYLALNGVGSILWEALATGASRGMAKERLAERFPDVPADRLGRDAEVLLSQLQAKGLLCPRRSADRTRAPGPSRAPADAAAAPVAAAARSAIPPIDGSDRHASPGLALRFAAAYLGLIVADAVLRILGFARFHALVRRFPTEAARSQPSRARRIVDSVDRASAFYFKRAWCLQRSAVTVALLRLAGFPARLVIGVQRRPFLGHAWVELDGRVVNDRPAVQREFEVLETC